MISVKIKYIILLLVYMSVTGCGTESGTPVIQGELKKWHTVTISFNGPFTSEYDKKNPFLDYRLNVLFVHEQDSIIIPGFYAADGKAAETSAREGYIWKVRFTPSHEGKWSYRVSFLEGENIAVNETDSEGIPLPPDGITGEFMIKSEDNSANGFFGNGRLRYTGHRYLQYEQSGKYFIKGGVDSPENFLAYADFDDTPPNHTYGSHIQDWNEGDPVWKGSKGKGIIGALNYLASKEMNVVYFLTMNVMGDGDDVYPWTSRNERYRFDCSKLDQWDIVFSHFDKLGIMMHIVTQENENQVLLDAGFTDVQRKLYYRELVARFSHHLGITWNMGEENGPAPWFHNLGQSVEQRLTMAEYLRKIDPYNNLIVFHTMPDDPNQNDYTVPLLGNPNIDGLSLQVSDINKIHEEVKKWIGLSADSSRQWVVNLDEIGPYYRGLVPDSVDPDHDTLRYKALWGTYMAGGAGTEWYMGPEDLSLEDFRSRENMWDQTRIAMDFFKKNIPFSEMENMDQLVTSENAWCFAKEGEIYVIYYYEGSSISLDLTNMSGKGNLTWFNPRKGKEEIKTGQLIEGGGVVKLGPPPQDPDHDWVAIIRNQ